jgi:ribosomal-protein-alanine N-acetyltransferase
MIETDRLFLRKLQDYDIDEIFKMRSDKEIMRFIREPQTERDESLAWIEMISGKWDTEKIGFCGVIEKETKSFVGWCGLWRLKETNEIEVGYAINKDFWGKGYATEAARGCLEYGFTDLNLAKIVAVAFPENEPSQNVMKRLGMKYIGIGKFYDNDLVQYEITKEEFLDLNK